MKDYRLGWLIPLGMAAVSGCSWVDSSGRQENQAPGLTDLTQIVLEDRDSVSLGLADVDNNLDRLDYELIAEGGDLSEVCVSEDGVLSGVDVVDFASSIGSACDPSAQQECGLTLEPELLSSEVWASGIPKLRRPVAQQYRLSLQDRDGESVQQVLTLCIASESSAPTVSDDQFDAEYDQMRVIDGVEFDANCNATVAAGVLGNDTDDFDFSEDEANAQQCLVAVLVAAPVHHQGAFSLDADGGFVYSAGTGLAVGETDSFTYKASDGVNESDEATVVIRITGENATPTSKSPVVTIDEDDELILTADDLAEDVEAGELLLKNAVAPFASMGTLEKLNDPSRLRYVPDENQSGSDAFAYRVEDAGGAFVDVTVNVTVDEVNDLPTIVAEQGTSLSLSVGGSDSLLFTAADVEDDAAGNGLVVGAVSDNTNVLTVSVVEELDTGTDGNWQVNFDGVADGVATVTISVTDSSNASNAVPMTVAVQVGTGNQLPTVESPSPTPTTVMGADLILDIATDAIADDPDGDNNNLEIDSVTNIVGGTVVFAPNSRQLTFTPTGIGAASFDLTVSDEDGASATGTVLVDVTAPVTQPPVIATPALAATNGVPVTWNIDTDGLATDADTDEADLVFSGTPTSAEGVVVVSGDNKSITFTPSVVGAATISVTIEDPQGNSVSGNLAVTVSAAANIDPTVAATTLTVIDRIPTEFELITDVVVADSDGDANTVVVDSFGSEIGVTVSTVGGNDKAFSVTSIGAADGAFELTVQDEDGGTGQGTITVTVTANQSPTASSLALTMGSATNPLSVSKTDLGVSDADSVASNVLLSNLAFSSVPASSALISADLAVGGSGTSIDFTPDEAGDYVVSFDVSDEANVESFSVTITVSL